MRGPSKLLKVCFIPDLSVDKHWVEVTNGVTGLSEMVREEAVCEEPGGCGECVHGSCHQQPLYYPFCPDSWMIELERLHSRFLWTERVLFVKRACPG